MLPAPTPISSVRVFHTTPGSWVRHKCAQISTAGVRHAASRASSGSATTRAMPAAASVPPPACRVWLLVADPIAEPRGGGLEFAGGRHVDVVLAEGAPAADDRVRFGLRVDGELHAGVREHLLRLDG